MVFVHDIVIFFNSPKRRKIALVLLLVLGGVIAIVLNCCSSPAPYDSPEIRICDDCAYRKQLHAAGSLSCPKCGRETGALWKCMKCSYEFEYRRPAEVSHENEEARRQAVVDSCKCPNCGSVETFPVTVLNMPEKDPALPK